MPLPPERKSAYIANVLIYYDFRRSIERTLAGVTHPRILDYGAGRISPFRIGGGTVTAYEPSFSQERIDRHNTYGWENEYWTNQYPTSEEFDLVVANYSLHHTGFDPQNAIAAIADRSRRLALAEYDFTQASLSDFRDAFVAETEQDELHGMFGGDIEACFSYHNRYGKQHYTEALAANGFQLRFSSVGENQARFKFYLIGEKPMQPLDSR